MWVRSPPPALGSERFSPLGTIGLDKILDKMDKRKSPALT